MLFESRSLHTSKDQEFPVDYEDAFQVDGEKGLAAIADGVSSAIFSRQWADLLTCGVIASPPDLYTESAFSSWLATLRQEWIEKIDIHNLPWNQRQKLQQVGGAFSTLLWIELSPNPAESPADQREFRLQCFGIGDCCLFHIRDNEMLRSFPLTTAAEFDADPISICSVDFKKDHQLEFASLDDNCLEGDLLVLCTDAIGKWAMARIEAGDPPVWDSYWDMPHDVWLEEIIGLRTEKVMRYDDTTLVLLRVGAVSDEEKSEHDDADAVEQVDATTKTTAPIESEHVDVAYAQAELVQADIPEPEQSKTEHCETRSSEDVMGRPEEELQEKLSNVDEVPPSDSPASPTEASGRGDVGDVVTDDSGTTIVSPENEQ